MLSQVFLKRARIVDQEHNLSLFTMPERARWPDARRPSNWIGRRRELQQFPRDSLPRAHDRIGGSNARNRVSDHEAWHGHSTQRAHPSRSNQHVRANRSKAGGGQKGSETANMESMQGSYVHAISDSSVRPLHQSFSMPQSTSSQSQSSSKASDRHDSGIKHEERMKEERGATEQRRSTRLFPITQRKRTRLSGTVLPRQPLAAMVQL